MVNCLSAEAEDGDKCIIYFVKCVAQFVTIGNDPSESKIAMKKWQEKINSSLICKKRVQKHLVKISYVFNLTNMVMFKLFYLHVRNEDAKNLIKRDKRSENSWSLARRDLL